jgi:predicted HAD superfamily Cof-like phosphohydrolase
LNLHDATRQVREFHQQIGAPIAALPCLLPCDPRQAALLATRLLELTLAATDLGGQADDLLLQRLAFTLEELAEWLYAHARGDLVAAADAWADRLYVLLGDAVAAGLPAADLFAEIHASNRTKEAGRAAWHGKALKGTAFRPPDIRRALLTRGRQNEHQ